MSTTPIHVLLLDDDPRRRRKLVDTLARRTDVSMRITEAARAREVLAAGEPRFDVVLLSLATDVDVRKAARTVAERLPDLPIVVVDGDPGGTDPLDMVDHGVQDHVTRRCTACFGAPRLVSALRWAVERARLLRRIERLQEESERRALHDGLTDLPNRQLLHDRLEHLRAQADRHGALFAVLFVDLDDFKRINDDHGHVAGDRVLVEVARRTTGVLRESDTCARWGGDELVVLLEGVRDAAGARRVGRKILRAIARPIELPSGARVVPTGSVGVALYPRDGATPEALLRQADRAMYYAKARGGDRVCGGGEARPCEIGAGAGC